MWLFLLLIEIENAFVLMQMSLVNMLPWGQKGQKWLNLKQAEEKMKIVIVEMFPANGWL